MIISRAKNQKAAKEIINKFVKETPTFPVTRMALELTLTEFLKYFSKEIMKRVCEDDCYFVDMLEDFERIDS